MTPPRLHVSFDELFNAGMLAIDTVAAPGVHGEFVTGVQVWGVRTPLFEAVALITPGFVMEVHIPNGMIFTFGTLSITVANGVIPLTPVAGRTASALGAVP
jgi:hypothetical protein